MHSQGTVEAALNLAQSGANATEIARRLSVPRRTVCDWLSGSLPHAPACAAGCNAAHRFGELPAAYAYLLGLYLGDGSIATHPRGVYRLRFSLDTRYPDIIDQCVTAIAAVAPGNRVGQVSHGTWVEVYCYSKSWPCLFPQHGPGKKHERRIGLTNWQELLVDRWPEHFLRGLIHSDGCRFQNTGRGNWSWPRYSFTNHSSDIRGIFCRACEQLGLHWTPATNTIYVSRKADVARLDEFIGPKR
jgi:Homeodomain-like domain